MQRKRDRFETNKKEGEATSLFRVLSFLSFGTLNRRPLERPKKTFHLYSLSARKYSTILQTLLVSIACTSKQE